VYIYIYIYIGWLRNGRNFVCLYFLKYTRNVNELHNIWKRRSYFSNITARALAKRTAVQQRQLRAKWLPYGTRFAFVSSLKLSRRLLCSVCFVFVSTFNLQRGRAFVVGITNLNKCGCLCKGKSSGRPRVSEENVRRIQERFESSLGKSTGRVSRERGISQPNV